MMLPAQAIDVLCPRKLTKRPASHPLRTFARVLLIRALGAAVRIKAISWLWPRKLNGDVTMYVRTGRLLHWFLVGLPMLFATIIVMAAVQQRQADPVFYATFVLIWLGFAMLGRGLRYLLARE